MTRGASGARQNLTRTRPATPGAGQDQLEGRDTTSVITMSFIIGPLSGALVAGGVRRSSYSIIAYYSP